MRVRADVTERKQSGREAVLLVFLFGYNCKIDVVVFLLIIFFLFLGRTF